MKKIFIGMCLLGLVVSGSAQALMPPFSDEELNAQATRIVQGTIKSVVCTNEEHHSTCSDQRGYVATLQINKTLKGEPAESVKLFFLRTTFKNGCVGSAAHLHYAGDSGKYYLKCTGEECSLVHWNGVEDEKRGESQLPECVYFKRSLLKQKK